MYTYTEFTVFNALEIIGKKTLRIGFERGKLKKDKSTTTIILTQNVQINEQNNNRKKNYDKISQHLNAYKIKIRNSCHRESCVRRTDTQRNAEIDGIQFEI